MGGGKTVLPASISPEQFEGSDDCDESDESSSPPSSTPSATFLDTIAGSNGVPQCKTYIALLESYRSIRVPPSSVVDDAVRAILRHKPGDWMEKVGGLSFGSYDIPATTTILLVGPRVSGKSSLVNRITRVFEDDQSALDRAQVSDAWAAAGTYFLREYPIPKHSETLCVYDTRGLSMVPSENIKLFERWMLEGVSHGEMDIRSSDDSLTRRNMMIKARQISRYPCTKRVVNYVILVVNGVSILESLESKETQYIDMTMETFNSPFLSFRDDKPVVAITHCDKLSIEDRAFLRANLGEMLGIPSSTQIFDIPDNMEYATKIAIVNMLRFCIERADRNILPKPTYQIKMMKWCQRLRKLVEFGDMMCCTLIRMNKDIWRFSVTRDLLEQLLQWLTILVFTCSMARITWFLMNAA